MAQESVTPPVEAPDASGVECPSEEEWPIGRKAAIFSCSIVFLLGVFDFIDRQVVASLLPYIKDEWSLSDTQLGMLVSVVNISISVLVCPAPILSTSGAAKR